MDALTHTPISILDLAMYGEGQSIADTFRATVELARAAEGWGYRRFWIAEHHGLEGVASAATAVLIGHVAGATSRIRVGAGGIMLPNHPPLVVAEQFGTLATLYPGRIDLGLGRAPGSDAETMRALRRDTRFTGDDFPELIEELVAYFAPAPPQARHKAIPGAGIDVPIYLLGSSLYSARLAARLGRPYAFAGHFAPALMQDAFAIYRAEFRPSAALAKPYVIAGVPVIAAETDARAHYLATSLYQRFLGMVRGNRHPTQPPVPSMDGLWSPAEEEAVRAMTELLVVGGEKTVRAGLERFVAVTDADELIVASETYDKGDRLRSFEILMRAARGGS